MVSRSGMMVAGLVLATAMGIGGCSRSEEQAAPPAQGATTPPAAPADAAGAPAGEKAE